MKVNYKSAIFLIKLLVIIVLFFTLDEISGKVYSNSVNSTSAESSYLQNYYLELAQNEVDSKYVKTLLKKGLAERSYFWRDIICSANSIKEIALTFDDGPHPGYTEKLLAILSKYNVKATFFVVGKEAAKHPQLVKESFDAGHSIGNHTYSHVDLTRIYSDDVAVEIKACGKVLYEITGKYCDLFRPPGGNFNNQIEKIATVLGYTTVLWTANSADYSNISKRAISSRIYSRSRYGGIVLMHDGVQKTIDILPKTIEYFKARGFRFVTLDEIRKRRFPERHEAASEPSKIIIAKTASKEASLQKIQYAQ